MMRGSGRARSISPSEDGVSLRFSRPPSLAADADDVQRAQMRLYTAAIDLMNDREHEDLGAIATARRWLEATSEDRSERANMARVRPFARLLCAIAALVGTQRVQHEATVFAEAIVEERSDLHDLFEMALEHGATSKESFHKFIHGKLTALKQQLPPRIPAPPEAARMSAVMRDENRARSVSKPAVRLSTETFDGVVTAMRHELDAFKRHVGERTDSGMQAALNSLEQCSRANDALARLTQRIDDLSGEQRQSATDLHNELENAVARLFKSKDNEVVQMANLRQICANLQHQLASAETSRRDGDDVQAHDLNLLSEEVRRFQAETRETSTELDRKQRANTSAIEALQSELRGFVEWRRRHEQETAALRAALDKQRSETAELLREREEEWRAHAKTSSTALSDIKRLNDRVSRLDRDVSTCTATINEWQETSSTFATIQFVDSRLEGFSRSAEDKAPPDFSQYALASQLTALSATVKRDLEQIRSAPLPAVVELTRQVDELSADMTRFGDEVTSVRRDYARYKDDVRDVRSRCDRLSAPASAVDVDREELDQVRTTAKYAKDAVGKLRAEVALLLEQASAQPRSAAKAEDVVKLRTRVETTEGSLAQFKTAVTDDMRALRDRLHADIARLRDEIADVMADDDSIDDHVEPVSPPPRAPGGPRQAAAAHTPPGNPSHAAAPEASTESAAVSAFASALSAFTDRVGPRNKERIYMAHPPTTPEEYRAALDQVETHEQNAVKTRLGQYLTCRWVRHVPRDAWMSEWTNRLRSAGLILLEHPTLVQKLEWSHDALHPLVESDTLAQQWAKVMMRREFLAELMSYELIPQFHDQPRAEQIAKAEFELAYTLQTPYRDGPVYEEIKKRVIEKMQSGGQGNQNRRGGGRRGGPGRGSGGFRQRRGQQHQQQQQQPQQPPQQQQQQQTAAPSQPQQGSAPPSGLRSSGTTPFRTGSNP